MDCKLAYTADELVKRTIKEMLMQSWKAEERSKQPDVNKIPGQKRGHKYPKYMAGVKGKIGRGGGFWYAL